MPACTAPHTGSRDAVEMRLPVGVTSSVARVRRAHGHRPPKRRSIRPSSPHRLSRNPESCATTPPRPHPLRRIGMLADRAPLRRPPMVSLCCSRLYAAFVCCGGGAFERWWRWYGQTRKHTQDEPPVCLFMRFAAREADPTRRHRHHPAPIRRRQRFLTAPAPNRQCASRAATRGAATPCLAQCCSDRTAHAIRSRPPRWGR